MAILINTTAVETAANRIDVINREISNDMDTLDLVLRGLQSTWQGSAATTAVNRYHNLKRSLGDTRFTVVNGMVSFMKIQVGEGYESMEHAVKTAAQAFK